MPEEELQVEETTETTTEPEVTIQPATEPSTATQAEPFFDPAALPAELQPVWKKMQASFTKKMQGLSHERQELSQQVDYARRLQTDPEFARTEILRAAPGLGLTLQNGGASRATGTPSPGAAPPPEFVEAIRSELPPELQWMAEGQAKATWKATQALLAPLLERQQQETRGRHEQEYELLADQLSTKAPTWTEHEEDIAELDRFLSSPALKHPVFGSKLELLYNIVNRTNTGTQEAVRRMNQAGRNRTGVSRVETGTTPNLVEQVKKAPTLQSAFAIAAKAAAEQLKTG